MDIKIDFTDKEITRWILIRRLLIGMEIRKEQRRDTIQENPGENHIILLWHS
jgi:hypothetical protein